MCQYFLSTPILLCDVGMMSSTGARPLSSKHLRHTSRPSFDKRPQSAGNTIDNDDNSKYIYWMLLGNRLVLGCFGSIEYGDQCTSNK